MKQTSRLRSSENRFAATGGSRRAANMQERLEMIREAAEKRPQNRKPQPMYGALVASKEEQ